MRIVCENGFYKFFPDNIGEIRRFQSKYGVNLLQCEDYFTFEVLAELPNFSFAGQIYSGIFPAIVNYAGSREEVLAANGYTYYQATKSLILKASVFLENKYSLSNFFFSDTLPQAYSYDSNGIMTGFNGFCDVDFMRFKIERFFYESI